MNTTALFYLFFNILPGFKISVQNYIWNLAYSFTFRLNIEFAFYLQYCHDEHFFRETQTQERSKPQCI